MYLVALHLGFTGFHLFEDYSNGFLFVVGHKNYDASHLNAYIKELYMECNSFGHIIKEIVSDAGSVNKSASV
jgi:hypothetical protein